MGVVRGSQWKLEIENVALPDLQRRVESSRWWSQGMDMQCGHWGQDGPYDPPGGLVFSIYYWGFPGGSVAKNLLVKQETQVRSLGQEDPWEKEMATQSSILAWEIPWTEETGELQSTVLQRVGYN